MPPLHWQDLCLAVGSLLEFENRCERLDALDENAVRAFVVRTLNDVAHVRAITERGQFGITGARAFDMHVIDSETGIASLLLEFKWVRALG
jgi:hypothetical protein